MIQVQADLYNQLIRRIDVSSATVTTLAGVAFAIGSTDGVGSAAIFYNPIGVAMDAAGTVAIVVSGCQWRDTFWAIIDVTSSLILSAVQQL
jgi:hypothetical protein